MKRKLSYVILICLSLLLFSSIVYAAFVMTHNYEANIGYHEITITEGTGENATSVLSNTVTNNDLTFAEPGDVVEINYSLKNVDTKNYQHYYTLSTTSTDSKLLNMIYVYQNNEYCGVLSECLKNGLLDPEYILAGETGRTSTIKFELHNGASTYVTGTVTIPVKVTCNISTVDAQKVLFADADASNFTKIIDDINSEVGKTVVLTSALTTTSEYTIANNCTIDLCGQTLTLGANITIAPGVEVKIINSRSAGSVAGSGKFVLNSADSFIELEATLPQANLQATTYNTTRLQEELAERFANNNIMVCGQAFDLLGSYVAYNPTVTITNGLTVTNGVVEAATTELATNQVVDVTIGGTLYEFKYIGNDDEVFASIINDDLKHLSQYIEGNVARVSNNIFLPTIIKEHNATISWFSSNATVMNNNGVIQSGEGSITLTATIKLYDKIYTKIYYLSIVQEDNLSRLQYLAICVENGTTLTKGTTDTTDDITTDVVLTQVGINGKKPLPIAGDANKTSSTYYTYWTEGGKSLGIKDLKYEIESSYNYLSLEYTNGANVYLNKMTFSKTAKVKMIGTFDNGEVHEVYINVKIDLAESTEFENEVFKQVQEYLDSVSVLQHILDTREKYGVLYEKGDFEVPSLIQDVNIRYSLPDNTHADYTRLNALYEVLTDKNDDGTVTTKVVFKDYTQFGLLDETIDILVEIYVDGESVADPRLLTFTIPGAVTTNNLPVFDFNNNSLKRIFYSFKYQTLQQSDSPYYSIVSGTKTNLSELTKPEQVYALGDTYDYTTQAKLKDEDGNVIQEGYREYILMYDIENTEKLIFEYNSKPIIIDQYDLSIFNQIITWAKATTAAKVKDTTFGNYIDSSLGWIESDGSESISDEEITIVLSYCERYPGLLEIWNKGNSTNSNKPIVSVYDNVLSDEDINKLLQAISSDKTLINIINWITDDSNSAKTIQNWLSDNGITLDNELTDTIKVLNNDAQKTVSNDEERVLLYYVLKNKKDNYSNFYTKWKEVIVRSNDGESSVKTVAADKPFEKIVHNSVYGNYGTITLEKTYDPYFVQIMNWITYSTASEPGSGQSLSSYLNNEQLQYELGNPSNIWGFESDSYGDYVSNKHGDMLNANEWTVLWDYLAYYGIDEITITSTSTNWRGETTGKHIFTYKYSSETIEWEEKYKYSVDNTGDYPVYTTSLITKDFADLNAKNVADLDVILESSQYDGGLRMTELFVDTIVAKVNSYYTTDVMKTNITNFNSLVNWSKDSTVEIVNSSSIVAGTGVDRIKDCVANTSYDEWLVLYDYCKTNIFKDINESLKTELLKYHVGSDMTFSDNELSDSDSSSILKLFDSNLGNLDEDIRKIKLLGDTAPTGNYDNLSTVSKKEFTYLVNTYGTGANATGFLNTLNSVITTYQVNVSNTSEISVKSGYDRTIDANDLSALTTEINKTLYGDETAIKSYKYLSIDKITNNEIKSFEILRYYINLKDLTFRGNSSNFIFATSDDANNTFDIVTNNSKSLERLTMNYCGLSNISSIKNLVNLIHLNIRDNYSVYTTDEEGNKVALYSGIDNINALLDLNLAKNNINPLQYLNIFNTDISFARAEVVLAALYDQNNNANLWFNLNGVETLYKPGVFVTNEQIAIEVLSLLYELTEMNGDYVVLPSYVYRYDGKKAVQHTITWKTVVSNSLIRIANGRIERLSDSGGEVIISASVTVGDYTHTRYFAVNVAKISSSN